MKYWGWASRNRAGTDNISAGNELYLSEARIGKAYTMIGLMGGQAFREKIYSMGLNPGVKFKILINSGHGPIELEVRQTKLAIGRGMARKIKIKENAAS